MHLGQDSQCLLTKYTIVREFFKTHTSVYKRQREVEMAPRKGLGELSLILRSFSGSVFFSRVAFFLNRVFALPFAPSFRLSLAIAPEPICSQWRTDSLVLAVMIDTITERHLILWLAAQVFE